MQNISSYMEPQPYQQYNPGYYQGYYQPNTSYYQNTPSSNIDWNYIDECNPESIELLNDDKSMQKVLSLVVHGDFQSDFKTNQNPSILKLFNLIKVVLKYQVKCISELSQDNKEIHEQKIEMENNLKSNKKSSNLYKKKLTKCIDILRKSKTRERCPRCHVTLASLPDLDQHMKEKHPELLKAWECIRHGQAFPVKSKSEQKLQKQIDQLKKELSDVKAKQRNNYYYNDNDNSKKRLDPQIFNNNDKNPKTYQSSSVEEPYTKQQPQFQEYQQSQPQVHSQTPAKAEDDNLAKLNAKKQAEDFLSHRRRTTPILPSQVDEIVHKIANLVHEQSKQINYGEVAKEEGPEDLRKEISDDVKSEHPMPVTSTNNNLKDLKKPLKPVKRVKKKKEPLKEEEEEKEEEETVEPKQEEKEDVHCYGDSMPLTSSSLNSDFVFRSDPAQYDSVADSSAPHKSKDNDDESSHSKNESNSKSNKDKDKKKEDEEEKFDSHPNFQMPSNDYDFAVYESAESSQVPQQGYDNPANDDEVEYYDEYEEEENNIYNPDLQQDDEVEYYNYDDVTEDQGHFHNSPQPRSYNRSANNDYQSNSLED